MVPLEALLYNQYMEEEKINRYCTSFRYEHGLYPETWLGEMFSMENVYVIFLFLHILEKFSLIRLTSKVSKP